MKKHILDLENLEALFPENFSDEQIAKAHTVFFKELSLRAHKFYNGKMSVIPKAGIYGFNWFNVWYTPGVSVVSTSIRDNADFSFQLTNRGNLVGIVSDSTRVLGDGDCTPAGGLGVMEGKAFLMKYLGGVDGIALCINSYNDNCEHDPDKIIDFVKMVEPSFGAINLEDISQPNCYRVLDTLRETCDIPVWHDDAQGTGCVTVAGLINALRVVNKKMRDVKIVMIGAGAANTTIARLILHDGANPEKMIIFDSKGGLHKNRLDIQSDKKFYRKWELCEKTNPHCINSIEDAVEQADVLIAVSTPGPDKVKPSWIKKMSKNPIVFACANPIPEIYPYKAKEAGAAVVATGRGDFPNQVNNSLGFPGILKGALLVHARKITDNMALAAAHALATFALEKSPKQLSPDYIIPTMDEVDVYPFEAAEVASQAIKDGVARKTISWDEVHDQAAFDIKQSQDLIDMMMKEGYIKHPSEKMIKEALDVAIKAVS